MTTFAVFALVALGLAAVMQEAESVCCLVKEYKYCADCTEGTPYCSYGKCNIFSCACERPCRENCGFRVDTKTTGWFLGKKFDRTCVCLNGKRAAKDAVFDEKDANDDGNIDHQEFDADLQ